SGYVQDGTGGAAPQICVTGGTLSLPGGWGLTGGITVTPGNDICLTITKAPSGGASGTLGSVASAQLVLSSSSLPFGVPDSSVTYQLVISFTGGGSPQMVLNLAPVTAPASTPYLTAAVTVDLSGGSASASGTAEIDNLPFGGPIDATFSVGAGSGGSISPTVTFTAAPPSAPFSPLPGLTLENITATVSSSGLSLAATALLGSSGTPLQLNITGGYTPGTGGGAGTLSIGATAANVGTWTPFSGLTLNLQSLTGAVTLTTDGTITYDFEAGTPPGAGTTPILTWTPFSGISVGIDCIALAFGVTPTCAAGQVSSSPTDPTLALQGSIDVGGASGLTVDIQGAIDLRTASVNFALDNANGTSFSVVPGLSVNLQTFTISGSVSAGFDVAGTASATIPAISASPITVNLTYNSGALVVAVSGLDLSNLGIPLTGFFAYSSTAVASYDTGDPTIGTVALVQGFNVDAVYTIPTGVSSMLQSAGFTVPPGGTITFSAGWTPGQSPSFSATLTPPAGFPFLSLPDGGSITDASLSFSSGQLTFSIDGTIPIPDQAAASISLSLTVSSDGSFSGSATVSGLVVFGQAVGLQGTVARDSSGKFTANITTCQPSATTCTPGPIAGPFTPFAGVPVTLTNVQLSLGTDGLTVAGTASVDNLVTLSLNGTLQNLKNWSVTIAAATQQSFNPLPGITINAQLSGTVNDSNGAVSFNVSASGTGNNPLLDISEVGVDLSIDSIQLGSTAPPSGCSVTSAGDLWLYTSGTLSLSETGFSGSVAATGCFDLTSKTLNLQATLSNLSFSGAGGAVQIGAPTITLGYANGKVSFSAAVSITISMPGGGSFTQQATLTFNADGSFIVGTEANLSNLIGSSGDTAYIYYSSSTSNISNFSTGDPTLQPITLQPGVDIALALSLPSSVTSALSQIGLSGLPDGTSLTATCNLDFAASTYTFRIGISLGNNGVTLFSSGGTSMVLDDGFLQAQIAPSGVSFGVGLDATLNIPSPGSGDSASSVNLTGLLTVGTSGINVSLQLGDCSSSTPGWTDAFGITGLTVQCAALQGGISFEPLFPNVGFDGTITSLPSSISNAIGYQDGAPITFAFNLDPFLLDFSIGTKDSTTAALEPLAAFGQGSLIQVYYARLYFSPTGATIGTTTYPAGIDLDFQAQLFSVNVKIDAAIGFAPPSISFAAHVSTITIGSLSIGPVDISLDASPTNFSFSFDGTLQIGPGSTQIGPALSVAGELSASASISVSTSGISAFLSGSIDVTVGTDDPHDVCYYGGVVPYPCDYYYDYNTVNVTVGKTGFSVDKSGVTLEADGYSVTFGFDGTVSVSVASRRGAVPGAAGTGGTTHGAPGRRTGPTGSAVLADYVHGTQAPVTVRPAGPTAPRGTWTPTGSMIQGRAFPIEATLPGGDVLLAGGAGPGLTALTSAEVYDPATKHWSATGHMNVGRIGAMATLLPGGDVLVAGGFGSGGAALSSAELFDPTTGRWTPTAPMSTARAFGVIEPLTRYGEMLVAGGIGAGHAALASAETYSFGSGTWSAAPSMSVARAFAAGALVGSGDALVVGGFDGHSALRTAEEFDPGTRAWVAVGDMKLPRMMATAVVMKDGRVLVVGDGAQGQVFDPSDGSWSLTKGMAMSSEQPGAVLLQTGEVLAVGGTSAGRSTAQAAIYEPKTNSWLNAGTLLTGGASAPAVALLSNGEVLVAGGAVEAGGNTRSGFSLRSSGAAELYSIPTVLLAAPHGTLPPPIPGGSALPAVLGGIGGGILAVGLATVAVFWRRRRTALAPAPVPTPPAAGPPAP
ncbi:MAG TPA: kelch repeat-containing protein, partial [Acidimicrobiales bacterium]|nr:kelch repeat-containing protein [Acidimicrobiales bacterium]